MKISLFPRKTGKYSYCNNSKIANSSSGTYTRINLPPFTIENDFSNPKIIEQTAEKGSQNCNILVNGTPTQELIWKVKNIIDNPLEKSKDLKKQYSEIFNTETKVGFEFIHNQNNPQNAKKHFRSVYDKTKDDNDYVLAHLNSIIGLTPFLDCQNKIEAEKLFEYIKEGETLSKKK